MRILVIDDDPVIRKLSERILLRESHQVTCLDSGTAGIELFRAEADRIELIVLDLKLDDMSGFDCLTALAGIRADVRFLVASGCDVSLGDFPVELQGQITLLLKPYRSSELTDAVGRAAGAISRQA